MNDGPDGPKRDSKGHFAKGSSGNKRGRPVKKRRLESTSQLARDFREIGRQMITVPGPDGPREITKHELVVEAVFAAAIKGKVGAQRYWMEQTRLGWMELEERHPGVKLAEAMRRIYENPTADPDPSILSAIDTWIKRIKRL